jgi:hypothetical protein
MNHHIVVRRTARPLRLVRVATKLRLLPEAPTIPGCMRPLVIVGPLFRGTRVANSAT